MLKLFGINFVNPFGNNGLSAKPFSSIDPMTMAMVGGGIAGAGALGKIFGGKESNSITEPFPGYLALGGDLTDIIRQRMKSMGERYPNSFEIPQPEVEKATESAVLGRINQLPEIDRSFQEKSDQLYETRKARQEESFEKERKQTLDRYNRLGLLSSTPTMQAMQDIDKSQRIAEQDLAAEISYEDLKNDMLAEQLANELFTTAISQGQVLGAKQRGYAQYPIGMDYTDWTRAYNEPFNWAGLGTTLMGKGTPVMQQGGDDLMSQLGGVGMDLGMQLLMMGMI